jgi:hypothetical protein
MSAMPRGYIRKSFHVVIVPSDFQIEVWGQFNAVTKLIAAIDHGPENGKLIAIMFLNVGMALCAANRPRQIRDGAYGFQLLFGQGHDRASSSSKQSSFGLTSSPSFSQ